MKKTKLFLGLFVTCVSLNEVLSSFLDFLPFGDGGKYVQRKIGVNRHKILDFVGLVSEHGYPAKEYQIRTSDGYQIRIHRIPGTPADPSITGKPVIYIQHGLLGSSDMFVLAGPDRDLAFLLADAGYDVWLGNVRGNVYGRSHVTLSPDNNPEFWEFSYHQIALYDVTAAIDAILNVTKQTSLTYIGHGMGATMSLVLLSSKPEYQRKINHVVNMATISYWKETRNLMKLIKDNSAYYQEILLNTNMNEIFPLTRLEGAVANNSCAEGSPLHDLCMNIMQYVYGFEPHVMDMELLTRAMSYFPAGTSRQCTFHFLQNMISGKFQMYDYGYLRNNVIYGLFTSLEYKLRSIDTPITMFYGLDDVIARPQDTLSLLDVLKNAEAEVVINAEFGHLDFLWAKDAKPLVYDRIMEVISQNSVGNNLKKEEL